MRLGLLIALCFFSKLVFGITIHGGGSSVTYTFAPASPPPEQTFALQYAIEPPTQCRMGVLYVVAEVEAQRLHVIREEDDTVYLPPCPVGREASGTELVEGLPAGVYLVTFESCNSLLGPICTINGSEELIIGASAVAVPSSAPRGLLALAVALSIAAFAWLRSSRSTALSSGY